MALKPPYVVFFARYDKEQRAIEVSGGTKRVPSHNTLLKIGATEMIGREPECFSVVGLIDDVCNPSLYHLAQRC